MESGVYTMTMYHQTQYLAVRNNVFYFNRRVPLELENQLDMRRIIKSLPMLLF